MDGSQLWAHVTPQLNHDISGALAINKQRLPDEECHPPQFTAKGREFLPTLGTDIRYRSCWFLILT
jgi:hypothetical protein